MACCVELFQGRGGASGPPTEPGRRVLEGNRRRVRGTNADVERKPKDILEFNSKSMTHFSEYTQSLSLHLCLGSSFSSTNSTESLYVMKKKPFSKHGQVITVSIVTSLLV